MSHKSQLLKNTAIIAIGKLSTQIISYILLPFFTARMAVEEYGTYDFVCTISIFLGPLITLLMEESMFRFLIDAKGDKDKKEIISQAMVYSIIGVIIFIPLAFIYLLVNSKYTLMFIITLIVFVISNVGKELSNALARGLSQIKLFSFANFLLGVATIILTIIMLITKPNAEGMLWANSIANIGMTIYIFKKLKLHKYLSKPNKKIMKQMIKFSVPLVPNSISWSVINMSDRIIITQLINEAANGIYAMASKFPNIVNVLYGYFYIAWKESAAKIVKDENKASFFNGIYLDMKKLMFSAMICLIAVMPFAFPIFINKNYNEAYQYIPIIMLATYFSCIASFYGGIFTAYKETKIMGSTTIIGATVNLILDLLLIKYIGIYSACLSTLIADILIYYYRKIKLKKHIKLKEMNILGPLCIFTIVHLAYYLKFIPNVPMIIYWVINLITLLIAIIYSFIINRKMIFEFMYKLKNRY